MKKKIDIGVIDMNKLMKAKKISYLDREGVYKDTGYKSISTFYEDFSIADTMGIDAVKMMYDVLKTVWCRDYKYVTELEVSLILKRDEWWDKCNDEYHDTYDDLIFDLLIYVSQQCGFSEDELLYFYDAIQSVEN